MSEDEQTLYFYNPGTGDASWLERDRQMIAALDAQLPAGTWVLCHRPFGPPCGGYYYKLQFTGDAMAIKSKIAAIGIGESVTAALHFETP
jgi:hypothetical protein